MHDGTRTAKEWPRTGAIPNVRRSRCWRSELVADPPVGVIAVRIGAAIGVMGATRIGVARRAPPVMRPVRVPIGSTPPAAIVPISGTIVGHADSDSGVTDTDVKTLGA